MTRAPLGSPKKALLRTLCIYSFWYLGFLLQCNAGWCISFGRWITTQITEITLLLEGFCQFCAIKYTNNSQMDILSNNTVQLLLSTQNALHYKPHSASLFTNSNSNNQTQFTSWARLTGLLFTAVEKDIPKSITQKLSLVCTKQSIVTVARQLTGNL